MRTGRGAAFASVLVLLVLAGTAEAAMPRVAGVQVALRAEGLYGGRIDGVKGPLTTRAVRTFQRRNDLAVDGIAGPRTRAELGRLGRPLPGTRVLRRGMVGLDVSALQFRLRQRGVAPGAVDGVFGPATAGAVRRFQGRAGLAVDGVAGPATHRALKQGKARSRAAARPRVRSASPASIRIALAHWSAYYGVSPSLVRALAWMESGHQNHVVSSTGAWGVMQVMPATWRFVETVLLGRRVPRTANGNVRVGVAYLHHLLRTFRGNTRLALGAYHQGPAAVRRHGLYPETRRFVRAVRALERRM
jgi:peptidoglycan hydrolase-like protein with peptidoglycan-binding domain